jgi:hypothetical protein
VELPFGPMAERILGLILGSCSRLSQPKDEEAARYDDEDNEGRPDHSGYVPPAEGGDGRYRGAETQGTDRDEQAPSRGLDQYRLERCVERHHNG